jgi:monovalent cation:H+ antiporter, CPA1 family
MSVFEIATILIVLTAVFSFINARYIKLPPTVGVTLMAMLASLCVALIGGTGSQFRDEAARVLGQIDFNRLVLHGILAFLLFAAALHLEINDLAREWWPIALLSTFGTAMSTIAIGAAMYWILSWTGISMGMVPCLLFGALISPTDPVAVLGILKRERAPKSLETQMAGESLFNDGIGVVFFLTILETATGGKSPHAMDVLVLLLREVGGGVALGLICGFLAFQVIRRVDRYQVEVLITLALAMGVYAVGDGLGVSAPIAVVVAGLLIGNHGRRLTMARKTREHVDTFWELIDEILNAMLFMLMGFEVLIMPYRWAYFWAGLIAIVVVLLVRWGSVAGIVGTTGLRRKYMRGTIIVLTWGGLRGALSLAMALALPMDEHRNLILAMTYTVVVFSVLVQGLSFGKVARRMCKIDGAIQ